MGGSKQPEDMTLVWERQEPVTRAGTPALTSSSLAQTALAIADKEGLHAVSVKRIAARLGVPALRLQGYLQSRGDVFDLMLDHALGEIELPELPDDRSQWRADLRAIAEATLAAAQRHPWLRTLAGARTPCGPNGLRNSERVLASLDGLGLDVVTATQAVNTVLAYVYGYVQLEMSHQEFKAEETKQLERRNHTAQYLLRAAAPETYPTLAKVFAVAPQLSAESGFSAGLEYVLSGIAISVSDIAHRSA